jgi:hypothetical protein
MEEIQKSSHSYFHLKPIKDSKVLSAISAGLRECAHLQKIVPSVSDNIKEIEKTLILIKEQSQKEFNERIKSLKTTIGKYWLVKEYYDDELFDYYLIYPYALNEEYNTYWFVKGYLGSPRTEYCLGMQKTHIYIRDTLIKDIKFWEISKETFLNSIDYTMQTRREKYLK